MNTDTQMEPTANSKLDRNFGVSQALRDVRKSAGASGEVVAKAMGLGRSSVCNMEAGIQAITLEKLRSAALALGAEVVIKINRPGDQERVICITS